MDNIQGSTGQYLPIPNEKSQAPANLIPAELLKIIFSQLNSTKDVQQFSLVNKKWNVELVNSVKEEELKLARTFKAKLIENMNKIATDGQDYDALGLSDDDNLINHGHFDPAVKCALKISDLQHQSLTLETISKKLMDANYIELGIKVALQISDMEIQKKIVDYGTAKL